MYIYSKCTILCVFGGLSYGYPMGMVWVSYGKGSIRTRKWVLFALCGVLPIFDAKVQQIFDISKF